MKSYLHRHCRLLATLTALCCPLFAQTETPPANTTAKAPTEVQKLPFIAEIEAFETAGKKKPPPQNAVLFLGSSSIRLWKTLAQDFPELTVLNRGFGGSQISDSIRYFDRIVLPHKPKMIVFYGGTNDIAARESPEQVANDFKQLASLVRIFLPETRLAFISANPSVARWQLDDKMRELNRLVKQYIEENDGKNGKLSFLESHAKLLSAEGKPRPEILQKDGLHLNEEGYKLWLSILKPQILALVGKDK
ncbi:MAG TPA: GDSL-type esterase/lipase family protein [Abditibacteriaceae bacterium]|jgi:lysophospholipase L1-like esterase